MKSVVTNVRGYDWEGDAPLHRPYASTVIYEMHVRGFTRHPNSGVDAAKRGTYAGLIEKIPYLQELGITAVELLPVHQFDPQTAAAGLTNYWGYQPISFFAPHAAYASTPDPLGVLDEFRDKTRLFHGMTGGTAIVVALASSTMSEPKKGAHVIAEQDAVHLFDPETGKRLGRAH